MSKLKTYGIITEEEYRQAERNGKLLITENAVCSYCHGPVEVHDNSYLYCRQHSQLALRIMAYPGYPSVPKEVPRYKQMHFFFSKLERNRTLFDRQQPEYIAREKGCPFCDRYLSHGQTGRDASLLNHPLFCPDCGVSFLIEVIERRVDDKNRLQLRFKPIETIFSDTENDVEHTNVEHDHTHAETEHNEVEHTNREHSDEVEHNDVERSDEVEHNDREHNDREHNDVEHSEEVEHKQTQLSDDDIARRFIETQIVAETEHFQSCLDIYTEYQRFTETLKRTPLEDRKLYKHLRERFGVEKTRRRREGRLQYGFIGLRLQKKEKNET